MRNRLDAEARALDAQLKELRLMVRDASLDKLFDIAKTDSIAAIFSRAEIIRRAEDINRERTLRMGLGTLQERV